MNKSLKFGIIGGDMRQVYLAHSLINDGHSVKLFGFENLSSSQNLNSNLNDVIESSSHIILPIPLTQDNINLFAPFSSQRIRLDSLPNLIKDKHILSGKTSSVKCFSGIKAFNYVDREDFAILNAIPTAEGAIRIAMEKRNETLYKSSCLVSGFGRIGKVLSRLLYTMGTNLTVSARKASDIAFAKSLNYTAIYTNEIKNSGKYDIIFNTIPFQIFDKSTLINCTHPGTLIVDLASIPGGIDFEAAKNLGINAIHALALPGKFTPKTAANFIKQTIYSIIKEENLYE